MSLRLSGFRGGVGAAAVAVGAVVSVLFVPAGRAEECAPRGVIGCAAGQSVVTGSTVGGTSVFAGFPACVAWDESGPDAVYAFTAAVDDEVLFRLSPFADPDVDLFLLDGNCESAACIAYGDASLRATVEAERTYYLVIDGHGGYVGAYDVELVCHSAYEPRCDGKECGPDGGPFGDSCGACPAERPLCDASSQCVEDLCHGIPEKGCCDGAVLKFCFENEVDSLDCAAVDPARPTCGFWVGPGAGTDGYYCGFTGEGGGLPRDCACTATTPGCAAEWECGLSDCGDRCGECQSDELCVEHRCVGAPTCTAVTELDCEGGREVRDTTVGAPSAISFYPGCGPWTEDGPEKAYLFIAPRSGRYAATLTSDPGTDLDLAVLAGECAGASCLTVESTVALFDATAGEPYFLVVDGFEGAAGAFTLTLDCVCVPDCAGRACGDDGCGGQCGTCRDGLLCSNAFCVPDPARYCLTVGSTGCCDEGVAVWCEGGEFTRLPCRDNPAPGDTCGWFAAGAYYDCGQVGREPTGAHPLECPWNPPCTPACGGGLCGDDDGCGGWCEGACPEGEECRAAGCVPVVVGPDAGSQDVGGGDAIGDDVATVPDVPVARDVPGVDAPAVRPDVPATLDVPPGSDLRAEDDLAGAPDDSAGGSDGGGPGEAGTGGGGCGVGARATGGFSGLLALFLALCGLQWRRRARVRLAASRSPVSRHAVLGGRRPNGTSRARRTAGFCD